MKAYPDIARIDALLDQAAREVRAGNGQDARRLVRTAIAAVHRLDSSGSRGFAVEERRVRCAAWVRRLESGARR